MTFVIMTISIAALNIITLSSMTSSISSPSIMIHRIPNDIANGQPS